MAVRLTLAKTLAFTLAIPMVVAVAIPRLLSRYRPHPQLPVREGTAKSLGIASLLAGVALYSHTVFRFATEGGGTPSPTDEPDELVTGGVYAHVRNPMYVAVLLVVLEQAFLSRSVAVLWWAAGCWIGFHNRILNYEEPHLVEKHGEEFEEYCERVPRWVPRLRPPER